jgi:hypothetical protein
MCIEGGNRPNNSVRPDPLFEAFFLRFRRQPFGYILVRALDASPIAASETVQVIGCVSCKAYSVQSFSDKKLHGARATGVYERKFQQFDRVPLLIINDFALKPLRAPHDEAFHDLVAARYERAVTILTSSGRLFRSDDGHFLSRPCRWLSPALRLCKAFQKADNAASGRGTEFLVAGAAELLLSSVIN